MRGNQKNAKEFLEITFSDQGIGIDVDRYHDKIFGLYQKFNITQTGKGFGLNLIKSQIEALGGQIEIRSKLD